MLSGDHPGLPTPWVPSPSADMVNLDTTLGANRGRGQLTGTIQAGDTGDLFKIVVPGRRRIVPVSALVPAAGVVTVTTAVAHQFVTGDQIVIAGATPGGYNGTFTITVTNATHFTYVNATTGAVTGAVTATGVSHATQDFVSVTADTTSVNPNDGGSDGNGGILPTDMHFLDTFVEIYNASGNLIQTGSDNGSGAGLAGAVTIGLNSLVPLAQRAPDGWAGFEATVGATYYIRVRPDPNAITGRDTIGRYALRIGAATTELTLDQTPDQVIGGVTVPNVAFGSGHFESTLGATSTPGWLGAIQQDTIYTYTTPNDTRFDSLSTFQAVADDAAILNPHIEVFSSGNNQGVVQRLATDTDAGRQNDSFTTYVTSKATTYYVRVRADDLRTTGAGGQPSGVYQLITRFSASNVPIDSETRLGQTARVITAQDSLAPWSNVPLITSSSNMNPRGGTDAQIFQFTSQGTGVGIVTVVAQRAVRGLQVLAPLPQPAVRLHSSDGTFLDFNKGGGSAQLIFSVTGNQRYYLIIEGFDNAADGGFKIFIEAHHTFDPSQPVDDHINTPATANLPDWQLATPLRFGDPFQPLDAEGNPSRDRTWLETAAGRGRILAAGDTDLFQFTAPVNQLSTYAGDDGNQTTPLYVGGNFAQTGTDPRTGQPYASENSGIWDGGNWFNAGPATEALGAINGPIFAMAVWNPTGATGNNTQVLAVGGSFTMVNGQPASNIVFRVFDPINGRYNWSTDPLDPNSANPINVAGPVFALASGDVIPAVLQGNVAAPELYVGGQFTQVVGPATANNIEALALIPGGIGISAMNSGVTGAFGGAGPVVRAITIWDPPSSTMFPTKPVVGMDTITEVPEAAPDLPTQVFFGGSFANGFSTNPVVDPMHGASPSAPGPITGINNVAYWGVRNKMGDLQPTLQGNGLANGFNITWGQTQPPMTAPFSRATPTGYGVNGPVNALTTWDDPGQRLNLTGDALEDIPTRVIIGGSFTQSTAITAGGDVAAPAAVPAANIIAYDFSRSGANAVGTTPAGPRFQALFGGFTPGPVRTLTTWHADNLTGGQIGNDMNQTLLAGGDNGVVAGVTQGIVRQLPTSGVGGAWATTFTSNGTVRALVTFKNNGIGVAPGTNPDGTAIDFESIYAGGDFTRITAGGANFTVNHVSRLELRYTQMPVRQWGNMRGGTAGVSPGETLGTVSSVFALSTFNDNITGIWDRNERPATKVSIVLAKTTDSRIANAMIRVFDSNFNLIYVAPQNGGADTLDPTGANDVPGANDPSLFPTFPTPGNPAWFQPMAPFQGFSVWGGEVYYVEVSDAGGGTGRYTLSVNTDALPPRPTPATQDPLGVFPDDISTFTQPVGTGQFATAPEIGVAGAADGKAHTFLDPLAAPATPPSSYSFRGFGVTPGGVGRSEFSDGPVIARVTDTNLFQFRAPNDGTVEIRLSTFGIVRGYQEVFTDQNGTITGNNALSKRINSPFHGAVRVFNNDFAQLAYSNSNDAVQGFGQVFPVLQANPNSNPAEDGNRAFLHSDPRIVLNVQRGNTYFIQVESAFKGTFLSNPDLVDWRFATGAYDLIVSATPSLGGVDDHWPNFDTGGAPPVDGLNGTAIPVDPITGAGTIGGIIHNIPSGPFANPNDADTFSYISTGRGFAQVHVQPNSPALSPRVRVYDPNQVLITTASGGVGGTANLQVPVSQGQRFYIVVDGAGTEGSYTVTLASPVQLDNQNFSNAIPNDITNPLAGWANATPLSLNRFLGLYGNQTGGVGAVGALQGSIENPADQDIYKFTAEQYEIATANVTHLDPTLNPRVLVYEINRDGANMEVFLKIGDNDDTSNSDNNSQVSFSVTPGRDYYVIVRGSSLTQDFGRYSLAIHVAPSDDHPDDPLLLNGNPNPALPTDFPNGSIIDLAFDSVNFTSTGSATGVIERATDTDLFRFTAPAGGTGTITVARSGTPLSTLALDFVILDANNTPLAGVTFTSGPNSLTAHLPSIIQGTQYYILVRPNATVPMGSTNTGAYTLTINTDPIDDYLPTPGTSTPGPSDFTGAANIPLNSVNGIGTLTGVLVPLTDSDLFKFTTLAAGPVTVRISTPSSTLNPRVVIYDSSHTQIFASNGNGDSASITFNAPATNGGINQFFVLVLADPTASGSTAVGGYTVTVSGTLPGGGGGGGGPDDFPNAGEWADAANIGLDTRTGLGSISGIINPASDTDLFKFTVPGDGIVDLQLNTPSGGLVDGQLKVYNSSRVLVFQDSAGILGATAAIKFSALAGEQYYVLVEPVGSATGSYTLRVDAQPVTHFLFFPEGFAGSTINEYVPMVNPNNVAVDFQVFARYETGANDPTPIYTGSIAANSRGGITVSTRDNQAGSLVRIGVPYSLEIRSTGPLGATFSHYDFNSSVGESFTDRVSTTWTFAEANKDHNNFRDFLLFYNPGSVTANLIVTLYYQNGTTSSFAATVDGLRRGGINFDADPRVLTGGKFGVKVQSDQPIVSSITSYNLPRSGGDGLLGDADGGNTTGVVTNVSSGAGNVSSASIVNVGDQAAVVTITADYGRTDIPKLVRVYTVAAHSEFNKLLSDVGLIAGQTAGITYSSNVPVTFQVTEYKLGDGDTSTTATSAAREYFFGDLFVNPALAGIKYIEQLGLYNPSSVAVDITATFLYADGSTPATATYHVNANTFTFVQIDQQPAILGRPGPTAFSLVLAGATPFVAGMTHYDLFLNGGWSAIGAPIGLTNPLSTLV